MGTIVRPWRWAKLWPELRKHGADYGDPNNLKVGPGMTKCVKVLQSKAKAKSMDQSQARIWVGTV